MLNFFLYTHCPLLDFCHDASSPLFFRNQLLVCNVMHAIIVGKFVSKNFRDCWFYCTEYFKLRRIKRKFVCLNIISMALNMTHIPFPSTVCEYLLCSLTYWMIFLDRIIYVFKNVSMLIWVPFRIDISHWDGTPTDLGETKSIVSSQTIGK